jgi:hypothetical protein
VSLAFTSDRPLAVQSTREGKYGSLSVRSLIACAASTDRKHQTYEWEPVMDEESGSIYYRNNVSGDTQWDMPSELDRLVSLNSLLTHSSHEPDLSWCALTGRDHVSGISQSVCEHHQMLHRVPDSPQSSPHSPHGWESDAFSSRAAW